MLKTCEYHSFIQRPHFSQIAKNLFRVSFFTPADIAAYLLAFSHLWSYVVKVYYTGLAQCIAEVLLMTSHLLYSVIDQVNDAGKFQHQSRK